MVVVSASNARRIRRANRGDDAAVDVKRSAVGAGARIVAADAGTAVSANRRQHACPRRLRVDSQRIAWLQSDTGVVVRTGYRKRRTVAKDETDLAADYCSGGQRNGCIRRNVVPAISPCDGCRRRCDLMACPRKNTIRRKAIDNVTCLRLFGVVVCESSGFDRHDRIGYRQCRAESIPNRDCTTIVLRGGGRKCQNAG